MTGDPDRQLSLQSRSNELIGFNTETDTGLEMHVFGDVIDERNFHENDNDDNDGDIDLYLRDRDRTHTKYHTNYVGISCLTQTESFFHAGATTGKMSVKQRQLVATENFLSVSSEDDLASLVDNGVASTVSEGLVYNRRRPEADSCTNKVLDSGDAFASISSASLQSLVQNTSKHSLDVQSLLNDGNSFLKGNNAIENNAIENNAVAHHPRNLRSQANLSEQPVLLGSPKAGISKLTETSAQERKLVLSIKALSHSAGSKANQKLIKSMLIEWQHTQDMWIGCSGLDLSSEDELKRVLNALERTESGSSNSSSSSISGSDISSKQSFILDFSGCHLTSRGLAAITQSIVSPKTITITALDLTNNAVAIEGAVAIRQLLRQSMNLAELRLASCSLGDHGVVEVACGLRQSRTLKRLDISNNEIERVGCAAIACALGQAEIASALGAVHIEMSLNSAGENRSAVQDSLIHRDLESGYSNEAISIGIGIRDTASNPLHTGVRTSPGKNGSDMGTDMGKKAPKNAKERLAVAVSAVVMSNPLFNESLVYLNIAANGIGHLGAKDLAEALATNSTVTFLDVGYQLKGKKIGESGTTKYLLTQY